MMASLIMLLADSPAVEVHVFGPGDGRGSQSAEGPAGEGEGDPIVAAMQSAVRHWHQVRRAIRSLRLHWLLVFPRQIKSV